MHLDNLAPLLRLWPLFVLLLAGLAGFVWLARGRRRVDERRHAEQDRRYRVAELAYRARMRVKDWLIRTKVPRLTYQGSPIEPAAGSRKRRRRK
jgi:hypothetical protein